MSSKSPRALCRKVPAAYQHGKVPKIDICKYLRIFCALMESAASSLHDYGELLLASRMRRVSELMYGGVDAVYREHGVELSSSCFPILFLLRDQGRLGISELGVLLGQSHAAVSQMSRRLLAAQVVREWPDPADERRRLLALSAKGSALMKRLTPVWDALRKAVQTLEHDLQVSSALTAIDRLLEKRSFAQRIRAELYRPAAAQVRIIPFEARYARDFRRLNVEWLRKYFRVEPIDERVLSQPARILKRGGVILLARSGREIIGTCSLLKAGESRFELSKMAITERYQGLGVGRQLLVSILESYESLGARELFLETNAILVPAIKLYESVGFVHAQRPAGPSHYVRANVYMRYKGAP
jgi:DNA-binding MarR family transcriptional regulator/GNAT superfamily N-acetyltransferase